MAWRYGVRLGVAAVALLVAGAAQAYEIAPHRAVYRMALAKATSGSGIANAEGAMALEWGESCEGWTVEQRYRLRLGYAQGGESDVAVSFATYEAKDGSGYRFFIERARPGDVPENISGRAVRTDKGVRADFEAPEAVTLDLPREVLFPTQHSISILDAAEAGRKFVSGMVFDGNEVEEATEITALIGKPIPAPAEGDVLLRRPSWPVRLAFFGPDGAPGGLPDYEMGIRLYDNGIVTEMKLDYGDFVVNATLDTLEALPKPGC
ncbi:cell envelope integrity EipB family protein [Oceanibaculum nanhaiense]|jgi:hypothetical protein|uniref:cell envelope integrity EipB family protein n=1 Tax=Oceanibaculum nanhaiense TaxID=1909734 RepID=UPI0025A40B81|nr:cell envelope integrity EipB family protein [Oceanibaculum nanhaiense]MDM7947532.1 cell envelope integrity EipB family protein [Oceanibaculum nanhaiense]